MEKVIIEIRDGVAEVIAKRGNVEVIIKDFDVNDYENVESDEDGNPYIEEIYDAEHSWNV